MGNRETPKKTWETDKSKNFCATYFSKLNTDQIEKKLCHFEDNTVSKGRGKPCRKSRKSTFRWVLTYEQIFHPFSAQITFAVENKCFPLQQCTFLVSPKISQAFHLRENLFVLSPNESLMKTFLMFKVLAENETLKFFQLIWVSENKRFDVEHFFLSIRNQLKGMQSPVGEKKKEKSKKKFSENEKKHKKVTLFLEENSNKMCFFRDAHALPVVLEKIRSQQRAIALRYPCLPLGIRTKIGLEQRQTLTTF